MRVNLHMITDTYLYDPPPFNGPFFMTPPFSAVSKSCDHPSVSTPLKKRDEQGKKFRLQHLKRL